MHVHFSSIQLLTCHAISASAELCCYSTFTSCYVDYSKLKEVYTLYFIVHCQNILPAYSIRAFCSFVHTSYGVYIPECNQIFIASSHV